jgi:hypothetical protein
VSIAKVKEFLDRPEKDEPFGWNGPGWYYSFSDGDDIEGPFPTEQAAHEALVDFYLQLDEWLAETETAEVDYYPEEPE